MSEPSIQSGSLAVTGAGGFIGWAVCAELLRRGYKVRALLRKAPAGNELESMGAQVITGDMGEETIYDNLLDGVTGVLNFAGILAKWGVYDSHYWEANVTNLKKLLKACTRHGVSKFTHCSTTSVNGNIKNPPANEDATLDCQDTYDVTKSHGELAALASNGVKGMAVTVIRPAVVYGPRDMRRLSFFKGAASGGLTIYGNGATLIHPVYIDDLVNGALLAHFSERSAGRVYIIGGAEYVTVEKWAETIADTAGAPRNFRHSPILPAKVMIAVMEKIFTAFQVEPPLIRRKLGFFIKNRAYDISRARAELGFNPSVSLEDGAGKTLEWYRSAGYIP
ncbi:MAG: NAD(P)-dependent oxidoreductase [Nitrospinae bacterium]|nr:NAD(P)-dependent oxidoreductase [Nitrospinota bacterium]